MNLSLPAEAQIDEVLKKRKILVTCGTGGVGKTTLSSAIAIRAALMGRKAVVVTIDPAKRLAHSLGLDHLGDQATDLTSQIQGALASTQKRGLAHSLSLSGSLSAIVPDTRKTFENFVEELAPNRKAADRVLQNPIFQIFAKEFSGTNEYMALERLLALHKQDKYDCIILDTPPSRNTLAFLNAPQLLSQFFEEKMVRWLVLPANKLVSVGMKKALGILEKLTGAGFMTNLLEFASALFEVQVSFSASIKKITALLESPTVGFLMVTTPTPETVPEVAHFIQTLRERHFNFDGIILNRTLGYLNCAMPEKEKEGYEAAFQILRGLQAREQQVIESLMRNPVSVCGKLPELARDIHSMEDLFHVAIAFGNPIPSSQSSGHPSGRPSRHPADPAPS